ncbi:hypothetical protein [Nocardioides daphniae]|nr:hypothetical protein [Nocardioides daphniae]QCC76505.1 hypothetical protein E2C04_03435 [Nocardioides daphniae]
MSADLAAPGPVPTVPARAGSRATAVLLAAVVLALVAAATWFAWLGWDDEYHVVDGEQQGPYRAWQVVGAGLTLVVATALAQLRARTGWAVMVLPAAATLGFAVPWSVHAAATDDSGLFLVGAVLLVIGAGVGLSLVAMVTYFLQRAVHPTTQGPVRRS